MKCQKRTGKEREMIETRLSLPTDRCEETGQEQLVYQTPQVFLVGEAKRLMSGYCHGTHNEVDYSSYWA